MDKPKSEPILLFYSNPSETARLRLDKEHRAIEHMLHRTNHKSEVIKRIHASTVRDILEVLKEGCYQIVQFSGHGEQEGIILESDNSTHQEFLSIERLKSILSLCGKEPRAILLMSCYSSMAISTLLTLSQYIITVTGQAEDDAALEFTVAFYETFLSTDSIETAFASARKTVYAKGMDLTTILSRRAEGHPPKTLFRVFPNQREDSILVDIEAIENDIIRLDISRETFLKILTQKIRVHRWLFQLPKEEAIIPLGPYFGVFTWVTPNDVVICSRLLKVKNEVGSATIAAWTTALLAYNDLYVDQYRVQGSQYVYPAGFDSILKRALRSFRIIQTTFVLREEKASIFESLAPTQFGITKGIIEHHLATADELLTQFELNHVVVSLEMMLTSFHDLVSAVADKVIE